MSALLHIVGALAVLGFALYLKRTPLLVAWHLHFIRRGKNGVFQERYSRQLKRKLEQNPRLGELAAIENGRRFDAAQRARGVE